MPKVAGPTDRSRVLRGGSFNNDRDNLRCANRNNNDPDNRDNNIGFRVVLVAGVSASKVPDGKNRRDAGRAIRLACRSQEDT